MQQISPQSLRNAKLVERYSRYISSPVQRLRFLQSAMRIEPPEGFISRLPVVGSLSHRALLIVELSKVLPVTERAPLGLRVTALLYRLRYAVYAGFFAAALALGVGVVYTTTKVVGRLLFSTEAKGASEGAVPEGPDGTGNIARMPSEAGLTLDKVWLAERGNGYEF